MTTTVAVAVNIGGSGRGNGSKRAVRWVVEYLLPRADRCVLVHVMPTITYIPSPSGDRIPIEDLDSNVAANFIKDVRERAQDIFLQYQALNKHGGLEFETLLLEHDNIAGALVDYISHSGVKILVMGSANLNPFWRKIKGPGVPKLVLKCAPNNTDIFVVYKRRLKKILASPLTLNDILMNKEMPSIASFTKESETLKSSQKPKHSSSTDHTASTGVSSWSELSRSNSSSSDTQEGSYVDDDFDNPDFTNHSSTVSTNTKHAYVRKLSTILSRASCDQLDEDYEVEQLRAELDTSIAMYSSACENLVHAQKKVRILSFECVEEAEKIDAAMEREEIMRRNAEQERMNRLQAVKEAKVAKEMLAKESYERQIAELNALKQSMERHKIVEALISSERRTRKYAPDEITLATNCFSNNNIIGEGGYGKVYRGILDHIPVAIKVLDHDADEKKVEFLKEVEILSQLHHPNIVLLLGVCPEMGCLVYEYMENGSLEDHIFCQNGRESLPWFARFRIAFEIGCGLAFLHSKQPKPVVHRDLKPGNILLGGHYVSKISDVGLAALVADTVPDSVTMFGTSLLAGTLYYMDPEYQRTGTFRTKSDLYSFGIILLQLLTGRHPNGLLLAMENAIANKSLPYILDKTVKDWPLVEAEELTKLAMECCKLRCRDRPDLETGVLPVLKKLADVADANMKAQKQGISAPPHFFCPILQKIMDDPQIAADGFTYERRAIEAWLEKHDKSPLTNDKLGRFDLTPNKTLLSAIQEWRSHQSSVNA